LGKYFFKNVTQAYSLLLQAKYGSRTMGRATDGHCVL